MSSKQPSLSYKDAGVDIDAGEALVERIKGVAKRTARPEVMGGLGGFGALCEIPAGKQPVLVSGTDGWAPLRLALNLNKHDSIGQDQWRCASTTWWSAAPSRCSRLLRHRQAQRRRRRHRSHRHRCRLRTGGLFPGRRRDRRNARHVRRRRHDLAGFCVGVVEKAEIIDGSRVQAGDALIALPSSGPHSNGYP